MNTTKQRVKYRIHLPTGGYRGPALARGDAARDAGAEETDLLFPALTAASVAIGLEQAVRRRGEPIGLGKRSRSAGYAGRSTTSHALRTWRRRHEEHLGAPDRADAGALLDRRAGRATAGLAKVIDFTRGRGERAKPPCSDAGAQTTAEASGARGPTGRW